MGHMKVSPFNPGVESYRVPGRGRALVSRDHKLVAGARRVGLRVTEARSA
jgi:hypothetical protein